MKNIPNWNTWLKAAGIRAIRTFAESALAYIGTSATVLGDVNWLAALSAGGFGFVTAILLALTVMAQQNPELPINEKNVRDNVRQLESQPGYQEQINFFLSTMSHDNRRPMNAIIGLMSITENDVYKGVGTRVNQKPASHWQI